MGVIVYNVECKSCGRNGSRNLEEVSEPCYACKQIAIEKVFLRQQERLRKELKESTQQSLWVRFLHWLNT